ncbi:MAG: winged helix-turn-helix domain-containing protein [Caulobacteraceae bacterium]
MNAPGPAPSTLAFGPFRLDVFGRRLTEAGRPVAIGDRALELLIALAERPGEVVPKADLMTRVWPDTHVEEANLRVQVSTIRRTLGSGGADNAYVANAPGRGYRFVAPVEQQTVNGAPSARRALWSSLTQPIGRETEIAAITGRLGETRLLTIVGPGGIGKTTLALACARALTDRHADGAVFAEVSGGAHPAIAVGASLGLTLPDDAALSALSVYLAPLDLLVVLDSCEYAIEAAARLAEALLLAAPGAVVLATSREPLRAQNEVVWRVGPLATPPYDQKLSAADATGYAAVRLFVDRAAAADHGFRFTDDAVSTVAGICRRLDGLPLAIELAAGRVGAFGLKGIEAGLDDRFQMLGEGRRTAMPRHRTLAAAVDWSYDALSDEEQRALQCLSLWQGPFDAASAAQVVFGAQVEPSSIYGILAGLVAKSLVSADTTATPAEYRLLDTTRDYAHLKLVASGELPQAAARHAARTIEILAQADAQLDARSMRDWLDYFGRKLADASAAADWALAPGGDRSFVVPLTLAALPVSVRFARYEECRRRLDAALAIVAPDSRDEMLLSNALASVIQGLAADMSEAVTPCQRAISLARRFNDAEAQLRSQWTLWSIHISSGDVRAALDDTGGFLDLAQRVGGPFESVIADRMTSVTELVAGNLAAARVAIDRFLAKASASDARKRLAWYAYEPDVLTRNTAVSLLWLEGSPDKAIALASENLARALAAGNDIVTAAVLADAVCMLHHYVGDRETAERHLAHLEMLLARTVTSDFQYWTPLFRAVLAASRGEVSPGLALLDAGVPVRAWHPRYASVLVELALGLGKAGAVEPARRLADQLLARFEANGERWIWSEVQRVRGELCDDDTEAQALFERAIDAARTQGARAWGLRAATSLARRQPRKARELLAPWLDAMTEGARTADVMAARAILRG